MLTLYDDRPGRALVIDFREAKWCAEFG